MLPALQATAGAQYFLTELKCGIFGVRDNKSKLQTMYFLPEGSYAAHGADKGESLSTYAAKSSNHVINMVNHFVKTKLDMAGVERLYMTADNAGHNKSYLMLRFLVRQLLLKAWGSVHTIELNFMVVGHTKFAVDGGIGVTKRAARDSNAATAAHVIQELRER